MTRSAGNSAQHLASTLPYLRAASAALALCAFCSALPAQAEAPKSNSLRLAENSKEEWDIPIRRRGASKDAQSADKADPCLNHTQLFIGGKVQVNVGKGGGGSNSPQPNGVVPRADQRDQGKADHLLYDSCK